MTTAIIDLGTNTFNLLIAEKKAEKKYQILYKTKISVKLGKGGILKNIITPSAFKRGIDAMQKYRQLIRKHNISHILAYATSAIRNAKNGNKFIRVVKEKTGIDVTIISGEKEAGLIYSGVKQALDIGSDISLLMDIGGGSTEFIIANNKEIFWKHSFELGVTRLLELLKPSNPIKPGEIKKTEKYLDKNLKLLFRKIETYSIKQLIGSSGSFESLAEIIVHKFYDKDTYKGKLSYIFQMEDYKIIHSQLLTSTLKQRLTTKGLARFRVDTIVLASIFINFIVSRLHIQKLVLSKFALREGVLWELSCENRI